MKAPWQPHIDPTEAPLKPRGQKTRAVLNLSTSSPLTTTWIFGFRRLERPHGDGFRRISAFPGRFGATFGDPMVFFRFFAYFRYFTRLNGLFEVFSF